jgi:hypothetical protein
VFFSPADSPSDQHRIKSINIAVDDMETRMSRDREKHQNFVTKMDEKRASNDAHLSRIRDQFENVRQHIGSTYDEVVQRLTKDRDALLQMLDEGQGWIENELGHENERLGDAYVAVAATDVICEKMVDGNQAKKTAGLVRLHRFQVANRTNLQDYFRENVREHTNEVLSFLRQDRGFTKNEHLVTAMTENKGKSNILGNILSKDTMVDLNY